MGWENIGTESLPKLRDLKVKYCAKIERIQDKF